ncbi:hypothetical protein T4A_11213, partial [Trichinella pseudospiralis]
MDNEPQQLTVCHKGINAAANHILKSSQQQFGKDSTQLRCYKTPDVLVISFPGVHEFTAIEMRLVARVSAVWFINSSVAH